ncbi:MAG: ADP-ribosylglycohydrolase family protein [Verrucomicrobiales bacterium]|nr:ADP-ribosylglycohydrolase family protein [Verrucomicrobiales bacterium]
MKKTIVVVVALAFGLAGSAAARAAEKTRRLSVAEYRDKMMAGWIGQMAGVAWGGPTEFRFKDRIIPEDKVPAWKPEMINDAFQQDDLYVEMTFLRTLERHGLEVSIRQAGIDFANSEYKLWCANAAGRKNLRAGIAPPDSSHPQFNRCPNDIDYQIEADYSGLIAPGLPQFAIEMGEKFGRLMNYGDGMYAGQFIGALYAEAFFESDRETR